MATAMCGALVLCSTACKSDKNELAEQPKIPSSPSVATAPADAMAHDPDFEILTITSIGIETKLAAMCGIPTSKVFFKFDSTKLQPDAQASLDGLATCAKSGAAKGQSFEIVGRADPVGTDAYNKQLGMSRADSVAKYLRDQGVDTGRVATVSKGEEGTSQDPWGWPYDRRVTVRIK